MERSQVVNQFSVFHQNQPSVKNYIMWGNIYGINISLSNRPP